MSKHSKPAKEVLQELAEEYRRTKGVASINLKEVASWAIREKGWQPQRKDAINLLARELQIALREQYFVDPQGRRVRQKHPQRISKKLKDGAHEQYVLWHDMREATRPQMQAAFQQRRFGVALDCYRLKTDVDSYNENYNKSVPIQLVLDFTEDVLEMEEEGPEAAAHDDD